LKVLSPTAGAGHGLTEVGYHLSETISLPTATPATQNAAG
jgi:hypothetical protein